MNEDESLQTWKQLIEAPAGPGAEAYLHLEKANDKGICFCKCERALVAVPDQMDCPWCGCGYLFACARCGLAFTYAKPVVLHTPLSEIVAQDLIGRGFEDEDGLFEGAAADMAMMLENVEEGKEYVYFDGYAVALDEEDVTIEGLHGSHHFDRLPHAEELDTPGAFEVLTSPDYWDERRHPEGDDAE